MATDTPSFGDAAAIAPQGGADVAGAASALVAALEGVWAAIVEHHPDVPSVVIVVAAGSGGRRAGELTLGHFAAGRWEVGGQARPEVMVGGEGLRRGALDMLGTLLHEAAHGLATARGVQVTIPGRPLPQPSIPGPGRRAGSRRRPGRAPRLVGDHGPGVDGRPLQRRAQGLGRRTGAVAASRGRGWRRQPVPQSEGVPV